MKINNPFKIILVAVIWITSMVNSVHGFGVIAIKAPVSGTIPVDRADVLTRDARSGEIALKFDNCGIMRSQNIDAGYSLEIKRALFEFDASCYNKWIAKGVAWIESTFKCEKNPGSSASGCMQFMNDTFYGRTYGAFGSCVYYGFYNKSSIRDQVGCTLKFIEAGGLNRDWTPNWDAEAKTRFYTFLRGSI